MTNAHLSKVRMKRLREVKETCDKEQICERKEEKDEEEDKEIE
jgi:hypothetical protein